ncbi:N-acetylglucosamine-6-phosphate deacetylase [Reticulibacter mediterranei]|uniref:N-acetylglucosamine-6-phosphate deacetylase n=1 Tax=Reticulibacter mediterranei TaxID=2778369 RepID=A0A8J3N5U8_9CHLR|nr:N-acetylglucosamine-6-phosphate deacetylase [Reticulibacter mediterranei]GHO96760.1 N-acetylglucosamine-6-phosphate deacetylase [Reticulibacter mediterranei]
MSLLAIVNGDVLTPQKVLEDATVLIEGERIVEIRQGGSYPAEATMLDAQGGLVAPGLIDIHVHGSAGYDTMDATPQALHAMATFFAAHGVTSFLPTTVTAEQTALLAAVENATWCQRHYQGGARIIGLHLEGPYISAAHPGAQPVPHIRPADPAEYTRLFARGNVRLISLAPEIAENRPLIEYAAAQGASVAVGHSAATYDDVMENVPRGLNQCCHTFNGMSRLHHREPGAVGAVLTCDEIYAQAIVDLVHLHPAIVKLLVRAKGTERVVLITDAMRAAGLSDGEYDLAGQSVTVSKGRAYLTYGNSLAGSVLTMDQGLRNLMQATELSLIEALPMATSVPARSIGLGHELGLLQPGYVADLVILKHNDGRDFQVETTIVQGNVVYQRTS